MLKLSLAYLTKIFHFSVMCNLNFNIILRKEILLQLKVFKMIFLSVCWSSRLKRASNNWKSFLPNKYNRYLLRRQHSFPRYASFRRLLFSELSKYSEKVHWYTVDKYELFLRNCFFWDRDRAWYSRILFDPWFSQPQQGRGRTQAPRIFSLWRIQLRKISDLSGLIAFYLKKK